MDKYGVEERRDLKKKAGETMMCPRCESELIGDESGAFWCPACGTEPFENTTEGEDEHGKKGS